LKFHTWKLEKPAFKIHRQCFVCGTEMKEDVDIAVTTRNHEILKMCGLGTRGERTLYFCASCFEKEQPMLESLESDGYEILDPDSEEFKDLDKEVQEKEEDGRGSEKQREVFRAERNRKARERKIRDQDE